MEYHTSTQEFNDFFIIKMVYINPVQPLCLLRTSI
jgi:hypothetical protein